MIGPIFVLQKFLSSSPPRTQEYPNDKVLTLIWVHHAQIFSKNARSPSSCRRFWVRSRLSIFYCNNHVFFQRNSISVCLSIFGLAFSGSNLGLMFRFILSHCLGKVLPSLCLLHPILS
ncbi:hypothetical protein GYMLUDRAFT_435188 [Collybiopsis luxurians FD-317 M1]|uniref:Uncharacterized protein n=1 Tax=Collybiopsis luxurians FD-317 M1 TaxID=944289 RepID=A0A0D0CM72_9AGAR|nr:hypothetical protein GYMLUDRAFT_435188 [Collybiopsis luxurians FD-317 M1]